MLPLYDLPEVLLADSQSFSTACEEMRLLKERNDKLQANIEQLIKDTSNMYRSKVGSELAAYKRDNWLRPVEEMGAVIEHIYTTLLLIVGKGYYGNVSSQFIDLNDSIVAGDSTKEGIKIKSN